MMSTKSILNESVTRFMLRLRCYAYVGSRQQGSSLGLVRGFEMTKLQSKCVYKEITTDKQNHACYAHISSVGSRMKAIFNRVKHKYP